jgi:hypothetical protein
LPPPRRRQRTFCKKALAFREFSRKSESSTSLAILCYLNLFKKL